MQTSMGIQCSRILVCKFSHVWAQFNPPFESLQKDCMKSFKLLRLLITYITFTDSKCSGRYPGQYNADPDQTAPRSSLIWVCIVYDLNNSFETPTGCKSSIFECFCIDSIWFLGCFIICSFRGIPGGLSVTKYSPS